MDPRDQMEEQRDFEIMSPEETLEGISEYLELQHNVQEEYALYKEDSSLNNFEKVLEERKNLEIFHEKNYESLTRSFYHHLISQIFSYNAEQATYFESSEDIYTYLDFYLRILREGDEEIWLNAIQKAPEIINLLSCSEDYLKFTYNVREIYSQLTSAPEKKSEYREVGWKKHDIIFSNIDPILGDSTKNIFNKKFFRKYPEIVTEGIINFCRSTEQLTARGDCSEFFLYRNLASKLGFLSSISWKEQPWVGESINKCLDFMLSYSKKRAKEYLDFKSFAGASGHMAHIFSEIFEKSLKENRIHYPEIFLKFPNAIMKDIERVLEEKNKKEKEGDSHIYARSLGKIIEYMLEKGGNLFEKEIRKYFDIIIKTYYEGDAFQRDMALHQLLMSLLHNRNLVPRNKMELKDIYNKGQSLIKNEEFASFDKLLTKYDKDNDMLKTLNLYRTLFYYVLHKEHTNNTVQEYIRKTFYRISTL